MDRISRCSQAPEESSLGPPAFQLFADVVLLASSGQDLQHVLGRLVETISTWKTEVMVLHQKKMPFPLWVGGEVEA